MAETETTRTEHSNRVKLDRAKELLAKNDLNSLRKAQNLLTDVGDFEDATQLAEANAQVIADLSRKQSRIITACVAAFVVVGLTIIALAYWVIPLHNRNAAYDTTTNPATLTRLAESNDVEIRILVAGNTSTPAETLAVLATDPATNVRWAVAGNPSADDATLEALALDSVQRVKTAITLNPSAPRHAVLMALATHRSDGNRVTAAKAEDASREIFELLCEDSSHWVRKAIIENPSCPEDLRARAQAADAAADAA